jgi:hypothetical protein
MKKDFAKIVTERPRAGGKKYGTDHRQKEKHLDDDFSLKREPMSMGRGTKHFTDVLGPIVKYLDKQVGRPWDKIYSEFCQNFSKNSVSQSHLLDHVKQFVETNVQYFLENKQKVPYDSEGRRLVSYSRYSHFYVCPETGLLKKVKRESFKYKKPEPQGFKEIDGKSYKEKDGIWYEVVLKDYSWKDASNKYFAAFDVLYNKLYNEVNCYNRKKGYYEQPYGREAFCIQKRQLNKKEIKKLALRD